MQLIMAESLSCSIKIPINPTCVTALFHLHAEDHKGDGTTSGKKGVYLISGKAGIRPDQNPKIATSTTGNALLLEASHDLIYDSHVVFLGAW